MRDGVGLAAGSQAHLLPFSKTKVRLLRMKIRALVLDPQLPEVEVKDLSEEVRAFELHHKPPNSEDVLKIVAHGDDAKEVWLKEIRQHASDFSKLPPHSIINVKVTS